MGSDMSHTDARESGVIKAVSIRGYGFIRRSNDTNGIKRPDLFVHAAECNNLFDELKPGTRVEFSVGADKRDREEAKNVVATQK